MFLSNHFHQNGRPRSFGGGGHISLQSSKDVLALFGQTLGQKGRKQRKKNEVLPAVVVLNQPVLFARRTLHTFFPPNARWRVMTSRKVAHRGFCRLCYVSYLCQEWVKRQMIWPRRKWLNSCTFIGSSLVNEKILVEKTNVWVRGLNSYRKQTNPQNTKVHKKKKIMPKCRNQFKLA